MSICTVNRQKSDWTMALAGCRTASVRHHMSSEHMMVSGHPLPQAILFPAVYNFRSHTAIFFA